MSERRREALTESEIRAQMEAAERERERREREAREREEELAYRLGRLGLKK